MALAPAYAAFTDTSPLECVKLLRFTLFQLFHPPVMNNSSDRNNTVAASTLGKKTSNIKEIQWENLF